MSDAAPLHAAPSRQALQAAKASKPRKVTGALAVACKAIVWEGHELDEAAKVAGLTTRTLRLALERPHVIAFLKAEREVFRSHVSAQNIHRAKRLRDESGNAMAQLGAMKFIEAMGDEPSSRPGVATTPGIVIVIGSRQLTPHQATVDAKPLIENETDGLAQNVDGERS